MINLDLTRVALRYHALFLDTDRGNINMAAEATAPVLAFTRRLKENGFCVSEELLRALTAVSTDDLVAITDVINDVMGVKLNWAPLVKGWLVPTGESRADHLVTLLANIFGEGFGFKGTRLPCGHLIPDGTFPLERYNGCPFCGTPFETAGFVYKGQGSKLKELHLFTRDDMERVFNNLLSSTTPLDGTQQDSLKLLLSEFDLPETLCIGMKETTMLVVDELLNRGREEDAARFMTTPTDILRYLWFKKTGRVQIIEPKTLVGHAAKLYYHLWGPLDESASAKEAMRRKLMLKYGRKECRRVASWLNGLTMPAERSAEMMNTKRGMWVRMIHALRLGEYSRRKSFEHLRELLDVFYHQRYTTWQGQVDRLRQANDGKSVLAVLSERPGLFARSLFSTMLRFGKDETLAAFNEVADQLPARLLLSLGNAAELYFNAKGTRLARPITGGAKTIAPNKLLSLYSDEELKAMAADVEGIYKASMRRRFAAMPAEGKTIYIDPQLMHIPMSVGDRASSIQDTSCALTGTRFQVEGDRVRLFMQWGKGLHAAPIDMDLSCRVTFVKEEPAECAYYNLTCCGCKHSGDIRSIPEMVGTAEYIEISLPELQEHDARYVIFTCSAYSVGALSPNLVVGWMNSQYPMKVSEKKGVAYDPSCVQHAVRVSHENAIKSMVFGVLDVQKREIIWLELPFTAQTLRGCSTATVEALLQRLEAKTSIGELLKLKAEVQGLTLVDDATEADEAYTYNWALDTAAVSNLLL